MAKRAKTTKMRAVKQRRSRLSDGFSTPPGASRLGDPAEPSAPVKEDPREEEQEEGEGKQPRPRREIPHAFVIDIAAYLRMKDTTAGIAALKSVLEVHESDPSLLLYEELLDCLLDVESYAGAYEIFSALVWVFDKDVASEKSTSRDGTPLFPRTLEPLLQALQDASVGQIDDRWRRNLLVIKAFVYCLQRDMRACHVRSGVSFEGKKRWVLESRISTLLRDGDFSSSPSEFSIRNGWILQATGCCMALWKRIHDGDDAMADDRAQCTEYCELEQGDTCDALLRLVEMLFAATSQVDNVVQRIHAGMSELQLVTRKMCMTTIQSYDLRLRLDALDERAVKSDESDPTGDATFPVPPLSDLGKLTFEIEQLARKARLCE